MAYHPPENEALDAIVLSRDDDAEPTDESANVGLVSTNKAAELLGVSPATVQRRAKELGGLRTPDGSWRFEMTRLQVTRESTGGIRKQHHIAAADGERDAKVIAGLEAGKRIADIVQETRVAVGTVLQIRKLWLESLAADLEGVAHPCQGCRVSPGNPVHSFCSACGPKARVIHDGQQVVTKETK